MARFTAHEHHVVATVRPDRRPRVGGTTVNFTDGRMWIGMMAAAARVNDLRRTSSCALHSAPLSTTLPEGEGDVRLDAHCVELSGDEFAALLRSIGFEAADFGDNARSLRQQITASVQLNRRSARDTSFPDSCRSATQPSQLPLPPLHRTVIGPRRPCGRRSMCWRRWSRI